MFSICACGAPLYPALNESGDRVGVTHETIEDDDYHNSFFAGLRVKVIGDISESELKKIEGEEIETKKEKAKPAADKRGKVWISQP